MSIVGSAAETEMKGFLVLSPFLLVAVTAVPVPDNFIQTPYLWTANCSENEKYVPYTALVQHTCRNPRPTYSNTDNTPGCVCKSGYLRDDYGTCVPEKECPSKPKRYLYTENCTKNEVFTRVWALVQPSCAQPRHLPKPPMYVYGCQCSAGFLRDAHGECVPRQECSKHRVCGDTEVWDVDVQPECESKCGGGIVKCDRSKAKRQAMCRCKMNFARTSTGACVHKFVCNRFLIHPACNRLHEHLFPIYPLPSCERFNVTVYPGPAGCYCWPGYGRDKNGQCTVPCDPEIPYPTIGDRIGDGYKSHTN